MPKLFLCISIQLSGLASALSCDRSWTSQNYQELPVETEKVYLQRVS